MNDYMRIVSYIGGDMDQVINALKQAHHTLTTHHGLWAMDNANTAREALNDGADCNGALDVYDEDKFQLDTSVDVAAIEDALASLE